MFLQPNADLHSSLGSNCTNYFLLNMALYSYVKAPVRASGYTTPVVSYYDYSARKSTTIGDLIFSFVGNTQEFLVNSKFIGALIPVFLIATGFLMIYQQFFPDFKEFVKLRVNYYDTSNVALASENYVSRADYISNPGAEYFRELKNEAEASNNLLSDPVSNQYKGKFTLSIPALGIKNVRVIANVESGVEEVYDSYLEGGLAHFNGTGLPISPLKNNTVIYGHSASGNYYQRTKDPTASFSVLKDIKIGDEIIINMEGKDYKYRVAKSKIVQPHDISIITGEVGKETLTLFTCYPDGNSANRFVVVANPA